MEGALDLAGWGVVAGRVLLGSLFLVGGIHHAFIFEQVAKMMEANGIRQARILLAIASVFQVLAAACLMAGILVAPAALGLAGFTVVASVLMLDFWNSSGPERDGKLRQIQSNLSILGGLVLAAATA